MAKKKAPAKKVAKKAAQKPVKPRSPKKAAPAPRKPRKAAREPVSAVEATPELLPPPPKPEGWMGEGSISLVGPGRIRWECRRLDGGIGIRFRPAGVRVDTRRISLTMAFKTPPTGATSDSFQPKVEDRLVQLQFQTFPGWEDGWSVEFQGVDEVPEIS